MASSAGNSSHTTGSPRPRAALTAKSVTDPVLRNALRYTISAREYATLHKYVISRSRILRRAAPSVSTVERIVDGPKRGVAAKDRKRTGDDNDEDQTAGSGSGENDGAGDRYNIRAIRDALRVFAGTAAAMKAYQLLAKKVLKKDPNPTGQKPPLHKSPTLRLSLSLSTILLLYRFLFRFLHRLRAHLLDESALPFRHRNPRTAATLTSPYAPALGASLAGLALGIYPAQQLRVTVAIMMAFRALEFGWNLCEGEGMVWGFKDGKTKNGDGSVARVKRERPWWWGSWLLQPFAFGQLLHAAVFDRDCFPEAYGKFIFNNSSAYLHSRPDGYPSHLPWPKTDEVVDSLAQMAKLKWPPFVSPTLFPDRETLPQSLSAIAPLTSAAHPIINSLACATLHPSDPSCLRTYIQFWLGSFPSLARFFLGLYAALALLPGGTSKLYHAPVTVLRRVLARALRASSFVAGSVSTAWASICVFQAWFPRHVLPTQRFFLGGFASGLWAWIERRHGRAVFLYSARASVDSLWKVGMKRRWWSGVRGGDILVFVAALMVTGAVYERDPRAIREGPWRRGLSWVRGEGLRDWSLEEDEVEEAEGEFDGHHDGEDLRQY